MKAFDNGSLSAVDYMPHSPRSTMSDEALTEFALRNKLEFMVLKSNAAAYRDEVTKKFFWDCTVAGFCAGLIFCIIVTALVEIIL